MSWLTEPCPPTVEFTSHGQINRFELIDHRAPSGKPGRSFTAMDVDTLVFSIQDDGRTFKVFIS